MAVPALDKVVVSVGMGEAILDPKTLEKAAHDLATITGQAPNITTAKNSIAGFKLREGMKIGLRCTLRGEIMYSFLERLVRIALPRVRDFRGISPNSFDGNGNYNLGIKEQIVFPELDYDKIDRTRGFQVTIVTTTSKDAHARELLSKIGLPFIKV